MSATCAEVRLTVERQCFYNHRRMAAMTTGEEEKGSGWGSGEKVFPSFTTKLIHSILNWSVQSDSST